jgi:hypothetical protein
VASTSSRRLVELGAGSEPGDVLAGIARQHLDHAVAHDASVSFVPPAPSPSRTITTFGAGGSS